MKSMTELHMEPASDADQSCHSFHLAVSPPAELFRYQDGFGNRVHHFNLLAPTNRLIAQRVLRDTAAECNLAFTEEEVSKPFGR